MVNLHRLGCRWKLLFRWSEISRWNNIAHPLWTARRIPGRLRWLVYQDTLFACMDANTCTCRWTGLSWLTILDWTCLQLSSSSKAFSPSRRTPWVLYFLHGLCCFWSLKINIKDVFVFNHISPLMKGIRICDLSANYLNNEYERKFNTSWTQFSQVMMVRCKIAWLLINPFPVTLGFYSRVLST